MTQWRVVVGPVSPAVMPNKTVARKGFETSITLDSAQQHVAVQALDKNGVVLGTSKTITPG